MEHDGPISQGIRDAIKASGMTPYEVAKRVTQGGRVRLAGPQIYRFLNRKKGLSLAILDEIALVLGLGVQTLPDGARPERHTPHRGIFRERLDRLEALSRAEGRTASEKIKDLDVMYNEIYRENLWSPDEIAILFRKRNELQDGLRVEEGRKAPPRVVSRKSGRRHRILVERDDDDGVRPESEAFGPPLTLPAAGPDGDADLFVDLCDDDDDEDEVWVGPLPPPASTYGPPDPILQAKLDSLRLPDGFDETGLNGKIKKLWDRYFALVNEDDLSPTDIQRINERHDSERMRIHEESLRDH